MPMLWEHWTEIVARLNATYPDRQIETATAREWYDELAHLETGDVWLAIRRLRTEQKWRPELAEILIACKLRRVEMAEQARSQRQRLTAGRRGVPMPPETKQALEILKETLHPDTTVEQKSQAAAMIAALADQLAERASTVTGEVA